MILRRGFKLALLEHIRRRFEAAQRYVVSDFHSCSPTAHVDGDVFIADPASVSLGDRVSIYRGCRIYSGPGQFVVGESSHLGSGVYVNAIQGQVRIGRGVAIGPTTVILSYSNAVRDNEPVVAAHVVSAPLRQWLQNRSFEHFYEQVWQRSKEMGCELENLRSGQDQRSP